jgi:hypothetical protein
MCLDKQKNKIKHIWTFKLTKITCFLHVKSAAEEHLIRGIMRTYLMRLLERESIMTWRYVFLNLFMVALILRSSTPLFDFDLFLSPFVPICQKVINHNQPFKISMEMGTNKTISMD